MFIKVSAKEGVPLLDSIYLHESRSDDGAIAYAFITANEVPAGVVQISEKEYLSHWRAALLSVDKSTIIADGLDTATVTAEVHPDLTEITFYHADTGELIATVPVDPVTHTATLQVTATTPGVIRIRAGEPTITKLNEVVITAQ